MNWKRGAHALVLEVWGGLSQRGEPEHLAQSNLESSPGGLRQRLARPSAEPGWGSLIHFQDVTETERSELNLKGQ